MENITIHKLLGKLNQEGTTIFLAIKLKYTTEEIRIILSQNRSKEIILKNNPESALKIKRRMDNGELLSIHSMEPTLEKIFLTLTGRELYWNMLEEFMYY